MNKPKVGIILGSTSDAPHAKKIGETLNSLEIPFKYAWAPILFLALTSLEST